jgi:hypothetical protein
MPKYFITAMRTTLDGYSIHTHEISRTTPITNMTDLDEVAAAIAKARGFKNVTITHWQRFEESNPLDLITVSHGSHGGNPTLFINHTNKGTLFYRHASVVEAEALASGLGKELVHI